MHEKGTRRKPLKIRGRMYLEERALIEKCGQEYLDYKKEVPALIPLKFRGMR